MILVDTNIVLRLMQVGHAHQRPALDCLALLATRDGERFGVAPQTMYEMYVVLTRPIAQNGLGLTATAARPELTRVRTLFSLLPETAGVYHTWEGLVTRYAVTGKPAHDARLVALMIEHRVGRMLTFNDRDFSRYTEIECVNPFDVLGIARR